MRASASMKPLCAGSRSWMRRRSRYAATKNCLSRCFPSTSQEHSSAPCPARTKAPWCTFDKGTTMSLSEVKSSAETRMGKSIEALKTSMAKIRTGRAHTGILDHVQVEYYGSPVPVSQVANVNLIDARTISVQVWEKNMASPVETAIRASDLGLNPISMGDSIRVPMPALTEERRRDLTKVVRTEGEDAKIAVRNLRRDANDALKKM